MTLDLVWVLTLAFAQVGVLVGSQKLLPEYYFASAQFFVTRAEFKWKAIVFRLAIPFTAGLLVPVLPGVKNDSAVAVAAGCFAWFLVLWPIAWAPRLMIPPLKRRSVQLLVLLWLAWWLFFTLLPLSGAALLLWTREVLSDPDSSWWEAELAAQLLTVIPISVAAILVTRLVNHEVPRLGDELFDDRLDDNGERTPSEGDYGAKSRMLRWLDPDELEFRAMRFSAVMTPLLVIIAIVAFVRRTRD